MDRRGDYYRWLFFAAGPLEAVVTNKSLGIEVPDDRRRMVGYGTMATVVDTLAGTVSNHDYIAGQEFSAADVHVGSHIAWGMQFGSLEARPQFGAYVARITARDAYQRANALDDASCRHGRMAPEVLITHGRVLDPIGR